MLVDNVLHHHSPPPNPSDLSDFVNLDLFTSQGSATSDSRDPSPSVSTPLFSPLPVISEPNPSDWFNFSLDDDPVKPDPPVPPPVTAVPWDFLSFPNDGTDSGGANASGGLPPTFAIDPQLMSSPVPSKPPQDFDEMKDKVEERHEEEDEEETVVTSPTVKVGGKGKSRKGTVQSGGVQKKATISAVVRDKDDPREDGDDWRPSPEEYKKMSSKEKRQLRNKISARNFRVRRKEYITTLEGDIAERDRLIDAIRSELGSSQSENAALRQEISTLKKALLASADRAESPVLPPPGPIPALPPAVRASASSALVTPNTQKDLPSSPRLAASPSNAFWGGSTAFGGITPVHTTLIPENVIHPLASVKSLAGDARSPKPQENINPSLNSGNTPFFAKLSKIGPFDSFAEASPFTMKALDAYWMHLWSRLAQIQPTQSQSQPPFANGSTTGLRPHHISNPIPSSSSSLSALLSGKHTSAYPTSPTSLPIGSVDASFPSSKETFTPHQALLATMVSQTLLQRLGSAFWQAFAMDSSGETTPSTLDADKIRRVLEGKAVVKIVDVEPEEMVGAIPACASIPTLSDGLETRECTKDSGLTTALEDSMRVLSLGKK
ncbi:hypothetical protein H4582DRAFT_1201003 [Lactarius indigo]|nr:hypothetical protein H4582DRAFT_1201003 [Lactarius indigo]